MNALINREVVYEIPDPNATQFARKKEDFIRVTGIIVDKNRTYTSGYEASCTNKDTYLIERSTGEFDVVMPHNLVKFKR